MKLCTCADLLAQLDTGGKCLEASCEIHAYDLVNKVVAMRTENVMLWTFVQECADMIRSPHSLSGIAQTLLDARKAGEPQ